MKIIAADLDRTVIPNGVAEDDDSVRMFTEMLEQTGARLIYVTARNYKSVVRAIDRWNLPTPETIIGQVGSAIHHYREGVFVEDISWQE